MTILICPVCKQALTELEHSYHCALNHSFDKSRFGYINLLLANQKNSKQPGDNKEMVNSRAAFLQAGYYEPIAEKLNQEVTDRLVANANIADIGCGTGYYLDRLKNYIAFHAPLNQSEYWGIDISKEAVTLAAKKFKHSKWVVSSIAELPFFAQSLHVIISLFSPLNFAEFHRLLRFDSYLYVIVPASSHLVELRNILFAEVKHIENDRVLEKSSEHFIVEKKIPVNYKIELTSAEQIANLFSMTPYYWRCTPTKRDEVLGLTHLDLTVDVMIWVFRRK